MYKKILNYFLAKQQEFRYYYHCYKYLSQGFRQKNNRIIYPTIIQLQTLNRCNGACIMCPYPYTVGKRKRSLMTKKLYVKIVNEIAKWPIYGLLVLNFQNEPFLDKRLEEFIMTARNKLGKRWQIEITTNGTLLNKSRIKKLLKSPPDVLNISLNAYTKKTYEKIMPSFSWNQIQFNFRYILTLRDSVIKLYLRFIRQADNINEYKRFKRYWNFRSIPVISYDCNDRVGTVKNYNQISTGITSSIRRIFRKIVTQKFLKKCLLIYSQVNITAEGKQVLCCNDYRNEYYIGDINHQDILSVFNQKKYREIRKAFSQGEKTKSICDNCRFYNEGIWI